MYHENVNLNLMVENVIHIQSGTTINVEGNAKNTCVKNINFWNPPTCSCENSKYITSITDDSVIMCDEIIGTEAKSYDEETKTVSKNLNEKK